MVRATLLAGMVALAAAPLAAMPAAAQSGFDATGQLTLSFKFGQPDGRQAPPKVGFRVGASNVPTSALDAADPLRRGLNLDFDRRDHSAQSFSGVIVHFGEAGEDFRLLDDPFSAEALGLGAGQPASRDAGLASTYGIETDTGSRQDRGDWLPTGDARGGAGGWAPADGWTLHRIE